MLFVIPMCVALALMTNMRMCSCVTFQSRRHAENELINHIFTENNRYNRPEAVTDKRGATVVQIGMSIKAITDIDERMQLIRLRAWFELSWIDRNLGWDTADYLNVESLIVDQSMVWIPDIGIHNSVKGYSVIMEDTTKVKISSNGTVCWYPEGTYEISCDILVGKYPYDKQRCDIEVGPWFTEGADQRLNAMRSIIDQRFYRRNTEWNLLSTHASCPRYEGNDNLICLFKIHIQRRPGYYILHDYYISVHC